VTFANEPGRLYAPARRIARSLEWPIHWERRSETLYLGHKKVPKGRHRRLPVGQQLVALRALQGHDATIVWDGERRMARIEAGGRQVSVSMGDKRVVVNRTAQRMRAWQGDLLVLDTRVSTGRPEMPTPKGRFTAGPLKSILLISEKYGNARMPWSVQIRGDIVIHGFHSVPPRAASHGCVRVPVTGANPAKWFYHWVAVGTPILVRDRWPENPAHSTG
jgi:hypothetical protein